MNIREGYFASLLNSNDAIEPFNCILWQAKKTVAIFTGK
jgi:hypothetical protein